jgi:hypothetical protein
VSDSPRQSVLTPCVCTISFTPLKVWRKVLVEASPGELAACIRVRNNSIGLTTSAAITRAEDPAISGVYLSEMWSGESGENRTEVRSQSYPAKYMTLPGTAMSRVGESPRHNVVTPSFRAIFRIPSSVELIVRRSVSATTHVSACICDVWDEDAIGSVETGPDADAVESEASATQYGVLLLTQKTFLQHAVTPRSGGRFVNDRG